MSCNCKRSREIAQQLGEVLVDETLFEKIKRYSLKVVYSFLIILFAVILVPFVIFYIIYQMIVKGQAKVRFPSQVLKSLNEN